MSLLMGLWSREDVDPMNRIPPTYTRAYMVIF